MYERFDVLTAVVMENSIVWYITPYSPLKVNRRFRRTCWLQVRRISQTRNQRKIKRGYSSTLMMEATFFSETSIEFKRTTRRYIPEDRTLSRGTLFIRGENTLVTAVSLSFVRRLHHGCRYCHEFLRVLIAIPDMSNILFSSPKRPDRLPDSHRFLFSGY
jgi:hypothetical protein